MNLDSKDVLYEDNHLIAVYKYPGVLVQGDKSGDEPLSEIVKRFIKEKYNKPGNVFCGVIHRLDRPVSGLVLLAKTSKGLERMNKVFQKREIQKSYLAVVSGTPDQPKRTLTHWLWKDTTKNKVRCYDKPNDRAQEAVLNYELVSTINKESLVRVFPQSGRSHQIRAQLSAIGCPIVGDVKYGYKGPTDPQAIALHAKGLDFMHPVKNEPVKITCGIKHHDYWLKFSEWL